ncbi:MAG: hypothetical protein WA323_01535 [Candidatus Nitrosopolaris sp.]
MTNNLEDGAKMTFAMTLDLDHVKRAVDIMRVATRQGIEIYMIYGSHDFTAVSVSIIDIMIDSPCHAYDQTRLTIDE